MTYLNEKYHIVKFELPQKHKIKNSIGVYRVVALPINFSLNSNELKEFIIEYMKFFRLNYVSNTDNSLRSESKFTNSEFMVRLFLEEKLNAKKVFELDIKNNENFFHKIKSIIHFLPSLYVGQVKDQTFKTRFIQHLNKDVGNSLINRINDTEILKKSYKIFIYLELEREYIDFVESFLIQTTNPIFNKQRS